MIKNIVFDMGGVLIDFNARKTITTYFPEEYHEKKLAGQPAVFKCKINEIKSNIFESEEMQ